MDIEKMLAAYIECALWSSLDDEENPLDENYTRDDIHLDTVKSMRDDCTRFANANAEDIATYQGHWQGEEMAGHDFWLTRNHHGAGFWDGDWRKDVGERLTTASNLFGECNLYVGDDEMIYAE